MRHTVLCTTAALVAALSSPALAEQKSGEAIFKEKCAACHPDGGNIMKPKETLKGLKNRTKIVSKIRKGGGGMTAFDQKSVSDADAKAVADYIIKTFKK